MLRVCCFRLFRSWMIQEEAARNRLPAWTDPFLSSRRREPTTMEHINNPDIQRQGFYHAGYFSELQLG